MTWGFQLIPMSPCPRNKGKPSRELWVTNPFLPGYSNNIKADGKGDFGWRYTMRRWSYHLIKIATAHN